MYEPAVLEPNWPSMRDASADGANEGSAAAVGAAEAGDAANAQPASRQAARPTIGRRSLRWSTVSSRGMGDTPGTAYGACSRSIEISRYHDKPGDCCHDPL